MLPIAITGILTLLLLALLLQDLRRLDVIPELQVVEPPAAGPLVSLLIPARNEAPRIGRCLDGALAQSYPNYEIIVVDDGSSDGTGEVLGHYAALDDRLLVINGGPLPAGWVGKCNACQQAAAAAGGEWLLFLDADTAPHPDLVTALVSHAQAHGQDMLTIFPFLELGSFWERVIMPPFLGLITAVFPLERQNAPDVRPDEVAANGQCILVRAAAYHAIGGHGAVRGEVLEDMRLAQELRASGARTGAANGAAFLRVRMYTSGADVAQGLTKNAVAGFRSSGGRAALGGARQFLLAFGPVWLLLYGVWLATSQGGPVAWAVLGLGALAALATWSFWALLLRRLYRQPPGYALLWPLGMLCYGGIAAWAAWRVWSGRGVIWKGREYAG